MKKLYILFMLLLGMAGYATAQTPKVSIRGQVTDTLNAPLAGTSVLLLMPQDSSLVTFTLTDDKGNFAFKNVKRQPYLLKATFMGYLPEHQLVKLSGEEENSVGKIQLKPISKELYEVVVKTAKAPLSIRGDTIEYDASKFKVPPGSTVEDLLKKLPGVEVLQDGTINAQGETVKRVTVDGKRFFGDDPKMATKNLGADAVKKVQIFNDKSEQAKLTGVQDGKREKTVNLELKDEAKKGGFGKLRLGVGTDSRGLLSGNFNKFDAKNQFSIIGFGNNVNQSGMSWDDYEEFKGSNAFNWGSDGDFGFDGNSGMRVMFFNDSDGDDSFDIPRGDGDPTRGFSKSLAGGINYNYEHKKKQFSTSYFYNRRDHVMNSLTTGQRFLDSRTFDTFNQTGQTTLSGNHRMTLRGQTEIDSLNTVTFIGNGRASNSESGFMSLNRQLLNLTTRVNETNINNTADRLSYATVGTLIYRRKFKSNKARNFAASGTFNINNYDTEAVQKSLNEFFSAADFNQSLRNINQLQNTLGRNNELKSSLLYVEPLSKKVFWENFYNISARTSMANRQVFDRTETGSQTPNTLLTRETQNNVLYNRLGTSLRYSHEGLNITAGLAGVQFNIEGRNSLPGSTAIAKDYRLLTPYASFTYQMKNNAFMNVSYSLSAEAPNANDLQPQVDNSNPLFIRVGNANLKPQQAHEVNFSFNKFSPATFMHLFTGISYNYNINQIVYNQSIDPKTFITTTMPMNITGGQRYNLYSGFGFPIVKNKSTINVNISGGESQYIAFINEVQNITNSQNIRMGSRISFTPTDWLTFYGGANVGIGNTKYSINTAQNQKTITNEFTGELNLRFPQDIYLSTNLNYRVYRNDRFNFNQRLPILNTSIYKQFGKAKKIEARLSAYDMFNKTQGIQLSASQNTVTQTQIATLSRYYMFSLLYNMRGITTNIKKRWF